MTESSGFIIHLRLLLNVDHQELTFGTSMWSHNQLMIHSREGFYLPGRIMIHFSLMISQVSLNDSWSRINLWTKLLTPGRLWTNDCWITIEFTAKLSSIENSNYILKMKILCGFLLGITIIHFLSFRSFTYFCCYIFS